MVQLRVYYNNTQYWLDLYEEDLPKINMSVEDITNTDATSTFSRTFRVPNTQNNYDYFKTAFDVNGVDYDVTIKMRAEILVDGMPFKDGQIRMQKVYNNIDQDKIEYEIVFYGETRNFASFLGERMMNAIPLDLSHIAGEENVELSWNAYPQSPSLTAGLLNGNVLYPLVDHGEEYDDNGDPIYTQIRTNSVAHSHAFIQNSHPLPYERFKPMIRAKALIDGIFAQTPYTYQSNFLTSNLFSKVYISAWGNNGSIFIQETESVNSFSAFQGGTQQGSFPTNFNILVANDNEVIDASNSYNPSTYLYTVPLNGVYEFTGAATVSILPQPFTTAYGTASIGVQVGGTGPFVFYDGSSGNNAEVSVTQTLTLNAGDVVGFFVGLSATTEQWLISNGSFSTLRAPGLYNPVLELDNEYKQVDFIRDILTMFRLVMAPSREDPFKFIIEPWTNYIGSGQLWDWSTKLDRTKDTELEPLFFSQTDRIEFKFEQDEDFINEFNFKNFKQIYGQLNFESNSELLKDTREVKVGFAPTPMAQIEGEPNTSNWVLPKVHIHEAEDTGLQHLPMKPKTRILFYTGLKPTTDTWYFGLGAESKTVYPLVSYIESWPGQSTDLNLNWARWFAYWGGNVTGYPELAGQSLYERYWASYISSLYNKFSRRFTGTFILDTYDLREFTFDDIIFVDGTYYQPEKIIDLPVGQRGPTKVQLLKINDYLPIQGGGQGGGSGEVTFYYYEVNVLANDCNGALAVSIIMQSTVPLTPGEIVSAVGSPDCYTVIGPAATQIYTLVYSQTFTNCASCYGEVEPTYNYLVAPWNQDCSGVGTNPITVSSTVIWAPNTTVTLTNNPGCWTIIGPSQNVAVDTIVNDYVTCEACWTANPPEGTYYEVTQCLEPNMSLIVEWNLSDITGQSVTIVDPLWSGCWTVVGPAPGPATAEIESLFVNCEECFEGQQTVYTYDAQECDGASITTVGSNTLINPGNAVTLDTLPGCWTILGPSPNPPFANVVSILPNCFECSMLGG